MLLFYEMICEVNSSEIEGNNGNCEVKIPVWQRNYRVKKLKKRIVGVCREHIIHLYYLACPVDDLMLSAVRINEPIYGVDDREYRHSDNESGYYAARVKPYLPEGEEQQRNNALEDVRKIVKAENRTEDFCTCHRVVQNQSEKRTKRP